MLDIIFKEPRFKRKKIILHKRDIFHDIDALSYKLAKTSVQDLAARDNVSSESDSHLDGSILTRNMDAREAHLRKRLVFCLCRECVDVVDNTSTLDGDYEYLLDLPVSFKDQNLKIAATLMHSYLVKSTLMDWYTEIGTQFGAPLTVEVEGLEAKIVDLLRGPQVVRHPAREYEPSYRIR